MTRYARRYRHIARKLSRLDLMAGSMDETFLLEELDLMNRDADRRFLDFYGDRGLRLALEKYGIWQALERRGYRDIELSTHADDDRHSLVVWAEAEGCPRTHLVELVVRRDRLVPQAEPECSSLDGAFDVLTVDWLTLRHPLGHFSPERPRLPGQDAPGLGIGERVVETLYRVVDRLGLDAMMTVAEHFHNAVIYRREIEFFDPHYAGRCLALEQLLMQRERLSLTAASWAVEWGLVRDAGAPLAWRGEAQVWAREGGLRDWIGSKTYAARTRDSVDKSRFSLDREAFDERWRQQAPSLEGLESSPVA
ncbi:MAG: hypothetical protein GXP55_21680 [Deltaproteobacteria bacterium]|nr:hypothetical protein [Deltaproteobacteria bacterium]